MELCSRCHKRMPVVFIAKYENNKMTNEGFCIKCARELGIKQVDTIIQQMGLTDEEIENLDVEIDPDTDLTVIGEPDGSSPSPQIDLKKLFGANILARTNPPQRNSKTSERAKKNEAPDESRKFLSQFCLDLTKKAREGGLDRVIGRDKELSRLIQILCRRQKNNPCLIGEPGVGKTAIAEALAQKIAAGDVPYRLSDKEVHLVDMTALVAGTQFRGQYEIRVKGLINEVKSLGNIILVIDEVHTVVGTGDTEGGMNAANILKPALSRGEVQVVGATTLTEYRKYIEKDAALERRFQPIIVGEPSIDDTIQILSGIKGYYEKYHKIQIPEETVRAAVIMSERYITDRYLPDKAIDLLDEASAYLSLTSKQIDISERLKHELDGIRAKRQELETSTAEDSESDNRYEQLAELRTKELNAESELSELRDKLENIRLEVPDLAHVIEIWTGIPASSVSESEYKRVDGLADKLKTRIIGQNTAVEAVARAIKRNRAGVSPKRKPVSFIFAGPTGVGKTELVKQLAIQLFNSPETLIRLDMSEFMEKHSVSRLVGSPPGYVGYDEAGQLTEKVRRQPYSVILFDEIEKAHPDVMNILLQILDDGRLTAANGRQVNFENTVIIMTTNAGSDISYTSAGFTVNGNTGNELKVEKALQSFLRPEFLNRVDETIVFRQLDRTDFTAIAGIMLDDLKNSLAEKDMMFAYDANSVDVIVNGSYSEKYGARNMRRYIQREVEDVLAERIISSYSDPIKLIAMSAENGILTFNCK